MNNLRICAVLILVLTHLPAPAWAQVVRSAATNRPIKHATADLTATLLLEAYNPDGSAVSASDFGNYTNFTPTSTWGIYLNYGVFPLGTPPATAQVGSAPSFVSQGGVQYISFAVPANQPVYFTCLWKAQAIGTVFMRADNAGKGYTISDNQTQILQLPYEFALSEYNTASQLISQYSASGYSFSADANALLLEASAAVDNATAATAPAARAVASYAALAIIMPLKERLVLEISNASISRAAPRQDFVLNYEGWGEWALSPASVADYPRAKKAGFSSVVTVCDWGTILQSPGVYDFSALDYEIDSALALGYNVSLLVNETVEDLPSWARALSFNDLTTLYYQNAQTAVDRYKGRVASIYAIGEIEITGGGYSEDQIAEMASQSFAGARAAAPSMSFGYYASAAAYVGYQWNPSASGCTCLSSLDLLEYLSNKDVQVDFVGLEMQYGTVFAPLDLQRVYEVLTMYHDALNVPINVGDTLYSSRTEDYGSPASFYWHDGLTEGAQAEWADGFLRVAYGLSFVKEFWWNHLM